MEIFSWVLIQYPRKSLWVKHLHCHGDSWFYYTLSSISKERPHSCCDEVDFQDREQFGCWDSEDISRNSMCVHVFHYNYLHQKERFGTNSLQPPVFLYSLPVPAGYFPKKTVGKLYWQYLPALVCGILEDS